MYLARQKHVIFAILDPVLKPGPDWLILLVEGIQLNWILDEGL